MPLQTLVSPALYFRRMVKANEYRLGNYLLHKTGVRILTVRGTQEHFILMAKDGGKDLFPLVLSPNAFAKSGFVENKKYPLLPDSREFILQLPIIGGGAVELRGYVKNNKECFARPVLTNVPIANNIFHVHSLQNLYFALVGEELAIDL